MAATAAGQWPGHPACGLLWPRRSGEAVLLALALLALGRPCGAERLGDEALAGASAELAARQSRRPVHVIQRHAEELHPRPSPAKAFARQCYSTLVIQSIETANTECPEACSFLAEVSPQQYPDGCHFQCVKRAECGQGSSDPNATVPDDGLHYCRRCNVPGCKVCAQEAEDRCVPNQCSIGYDYSRSTGGCVSRGRMAVMVVEAVVGLVFLLLLAWYAEVWLLRPTTNQQGLEWGLSFRDQTKLTMPKRPGEDGASCGPYPLLTNLQAASSAPVAGPGTVLHFNFQLAVVLWAFLVALAWYALVRGTEEELFLLGLRPAATPAQFCGVIHWGHGLQYRMMWVKVAFLAGTYAFTFVGSIAFSVVQLRRFRMMDDSVTMKDFMAVVRGLPARPGSDNAVEEETKAFLERAAGQPLVGVSLCWSFHERAGEVAEALEAEMQELSAPPPEAPTGDIDGGTGGASAEPVKPEQPEQSQPNAFRRFFLRIDGILFNIVGMAPARPSMVEDQGRERILELLRALETSDTAFAVFETEERRDAAVEACRAAKWFEYPGSDRRVTLQKMEVEPETVDFANVGRTNLMFLRSLLLGMLAIVISQVLWGLLFYMPYAYYVAAFTYARGDEPSGAAKVLFTILVVLGNQLMYFICAVIADSAGYIFKDNREAFYTVLYTFTCFLNIVVDLGITGLLAYRQMVGLGVHTVDGRLLADLDSLHDIFEAFSMQKSLGNQIWLYNFPSTFLVPFIMEPIFAIALWRHLAALAVRTRADLSKRQAEQALSIFTPMDMGRYADVLLNVLLVAVSFFCAPGYYLSTLVCMGASHVFILAYDHYRVLRCVPGFCYSSNSIDRFALALLGVPCGLILVAAVFKGNCMTGPQEPRGPWCVRDGALARRLLAAFALHTAAYVAVQLWALPRCAGGYRHQAARASYPAVARLLPCSWFSSNPVHCLRSRYVHGHSPPCVHFVRGKEQLLRANPEVCCHFDGALAG